MLRNITEINLSANFSPFFKYMLLVSDGAPVPEDAVVHEVRNKEKNNHEVNNDPTIFNFFAVEGES